jgi:hypothetical protein
MKALFIIMPARVFLLFAVTTVCCMAYGADLADKVFHQVLLEAAPTFSPPEENDITDSTTSGPPGGEESRDEDDTKEKVFHRLARINFFRMLQQLYSHQQSIFRQLRLEIKTPPPRLF